MKKTGLTAALLLLTSAAFGFEFSRDGQPSCVLVHPAEMSGLDLMALEELKTYLGKMTGAEFSVRDETESVTGPAVYVGKTQAAKEQGIDVSAFGDEEWLISEKGDRLYLTGGHPAGTYYAVRSLLEKAGCWSLAPDQEIIPSRPSLTLENLDEHKKPAVPGRNFYDGLPGKMNYTKVPPEKVQAYWMNRLRNRYNGGHGFGGNKVRDAIYLSKYFRLTHQVPAFHTMSYYIDPALFETHPEYFAMDESGARVRPKILSGKTAMHSGYCYTNPEVRKIALENLLKVIAKDRETGSADEWPIVYEFSALDAFPKVCLCPDCKKLVAEKGSNADLLLDFVNDLATRIREKYPDVLLRTFAAYSGVNDPPGSTRAAPNLLWQYCDSFSHSDCYKPLTHPVNHAQLAQLRSWLASGGLMAVWDYGNIGGTYFNPPRIECIIDSFPDDLKLFRESGILSVFYECETGEVIRQNFAELTQFLYGHLAVDPDQDMEALIRVFMEGYYGPAAPMLREYLETIRAGVRSVERPQLTNRVASWPYMTLSFMMDSYRKFKEAEKKTEPDSVYRKRLHYEMIPLLYLMLQNSDAYKSAFEKIGISEAGLLQEFKNCAEEFISCMDGADLSRPRKTLAAALETLSLKYPVPEKFRDVPPEAVRVVGPARFRQFPNVGSSIVEDPEARYGKAIKGVGKDTSWHGVNSVIQASKTIRVAPSYFMFENAALTITEIPQDEKYHWYKFPMPQELTSGSYLWGQAWAFQVGLAHLFVLGDGDRDINLWDCWMSLKFTGPAWVPGSTKENAIYLDAVVLTRPEKKE